MPHPDTFYSRTLTPAETSDPFAPLRGPAEADVVVVGGGIAGVSAAFELQQRGFDVALIEAQQIGFGASGRNGGQLSPGFAAPLETLLTTSGERDARALYDLSREGVEIVIQNTRDLNLKGVDPVPGVISVSRHPERDGMRAQAKRMQSWGRELTFLDTAELRELVHSPRFHTGLLDPNAYHIHPLNYVTELARHLQRHGVRIYENTPMIRLESIKDNQAGDHIVYTPQGQIRARRVILCGSGYGGAEFTPLHRQILPIATYVVSTRGLAQAEPILSTQAAISDTRLSCDYFRITPQGELLWGGDVSGWPREPANLAQRMKARLIEVFPQLKQIEIETAWTGLMGYARHRMPYLFETRPGLWTFTALGGHGLNTGPALARALAEALAGDPRRADLMRPYGPRWNGGPFGPFAAQGIALAARLSDRRKERSKS